jgi:hypothetical protein
LTVRLVPVRPALPDRNGSGNKEQKRKRDEGTGPPLVSADPLKARPNHCNLRADQQ